MKKRSKIIALVTTLCLCLSMFTIGVLAATSASLSVTSTLNFTADGVYIMVDASLKQGADVGTAAVLSGEGAPTQPTFKAYSYPRMATGTTPDAPNGQPSTTHFVNKSGAQASTWAIGDINYTSTNKVVVYEFMVYNYSPFEVTGTVEGISEALASYTDQLSITTYRGTSSADATATGSPTYTFSIPARTNETTPSVTCYKIAVTLNNFMSELATGQIEMNVKFEKPPEPVYDYFTYSGNTITGFSDKYLDLETKPETLVIPNTDAEGNDITTIKNGSYSSPTFQGLESSKVIIQEGITSIGQYAFRNCSSLTSIVIPEGITSIYSSAFHGCGGLTSVSLPSSLTSIKDWAFYGCSGLTSVSLPSKLRSIGPYAFSGCRSLTSVIIPEGVTSIGDSVFSSCSSLQITVAIDNANYSSHEGSLYNKSQTELIRGSGGVSTVTILDTVTSIGNDAFSGCRSLTSITIPEGVTSIGGDAFSGCSGLTGELKIPEGVTSIYSAAFQGCGGLTSVSLPSTLTSIGSYAFNSCRSLTSVSLPSKLTSIGSYAFSLCTSLKYIQITGNLTSSYTFSSGIWVRTDSADEPTDWTNTVTEIPITNSAGYYHQKSAWVFN